MNYPTTVIASSFSMLFIIVGLIFTSKRLRAAEYYPNTWRIFAMEMSFPAIIEFFCPHSYKTFATVIIANIFSFFIILLGIGFLLWDYYKSHHSGTTYLGLRLAIFDIGVASVLMCFNIFC